MTEKKKIVHSGAAVNGAEHLIERIENGDMGMEVMPKYFTQFSGTLEERDYLSYCRFLNSANGQKVLQLLEEADESELFEI